MDFNAQPPFNRQSLIGFGKAGFSSSNKAHRPLAFTTGCSRSGNRRQAGLPTTRSVSGINVSCPSCYHPPIQRSFHFHTLRIQIRF
ncbi:hypothetical protein HMPREF9141_0590 [Prevotella multiformis DSM 16608]|uniref:Uncharacterized protein n=1 Tax=Prevotella multiformis DSM 16608 TaxID=888743 RepID=F0F4S4_9BACT|nr:hypothetical protein HMPREF9141_0590 [Prevotella multiformis DSM 16608]